jgi:hypothetical protein
VPQEFIDLAREEARQKKERAALLMRPQGGERKKKKYLFTDETGEISSWSRFSLPTG